MAAPLRAIVALALTVAATSALAGCSEPPRPQTATVKPAPKIVPRTVTAPPGHAARANVERALSSGPAWLLRRVMREEVLDAKGKFVGWRLTGLPEEWSDVDLKPGDVVSRVNNKPLETPDEAWDAWKSVARAREIRVRIERQGVSREVVVPIDGEPSAAVVNALENDSPPPRQAPNGKPKTVTSLGTDSAPDEQEWESY
jgi:hypothetical protein